MICRVDLAPGMSGRLAITMSIPLGKLARVPSGVIKLVFIGNDERHCIKNVARSWLGYCYRRWSL